MPCFPNNRFINKSNMLLKWLLCSHNGLKNFILSFQLLSQIEEVKLCLRLNYKMLSEAPVMRRDILNKASEVTASTTIPKCQVEKLNENTLNNTGEIASSSITSVDLHCNDAAAVVVLLKPPPTGPPTNYASRRTWVTTERMNELRRRAQDALKQNKTFTIRGCFSSIRHALEARGWVEKLDLHRKHIPNGVCQVSFDDLAQGLPKRKPGETRTQYIVKCERNIISRFLEHMPIDFLWTNRKEKCDYIDQAKNPGMTINKFHRAPFTSKEGLCMQLKDFHWFYEEGTSEMYFPRCYNIWSPEELSDFIENFKITACIAFLRWLIDKYTENGYEAVFSPIGKIPLSAIDFAYKRCSEFIESAQHNDIDNEEQPKIWEHDWDAFLGQHQQLTGEGSKIFSEQHHRVVDTVIRSSVQLLEDLRNHWPQHSIDGYNNLWIIKPANKCRGRGIQLMDNLKKILNIVNPSIASKSRYVIQKYIERPLIIHRTKFDIRQWFLVTNVHPMVIWMYKESYLRFSSQEYSLSNHHESVHLTNHAVQKRYTNGKRDKRLPNENMWDCYSFQCYLRQVGKQQLWEERIYPGMRKAIVGTMLASQDNMDRRSNTFELFGADFMISEDFYPWLIEINSSPDLGATTSVTARMCPQCLEDVIKVVIDRRNDAKADVGNFELIYRQFVPPTPAYMGLNLLLKGKQLISKVNHHQHGYYFQRKERTLSQSHIFQRQRTALIPAISNVHRVMPTFNATEYIEKCIADVSSSSVNSNSIGTTTANTSQPNNVSPLHTLSSARRRIVALATTSTITHCPNMLRTPRSTANVFNDQRRRRSFAGPIRDRPIGNCRKPEETINSDDPITIPIKRFRSCGPRLTIKAPSKANDHNLKVIIQKCTIQKNQNPIDNRDSQCTSQSVSLNSSNLLLEKSDALSTSRSESNIINIYKDKENSCCTSGKYLSRRIKAGKTKLIVRNQSCQPEKRHEVLNVQNPSITSTSSGRFVKDNNISVTKLSKPTKQTLNETSNENEKLPAKYNLSLASFHAVGKKLRPWQSSRSLLKATSKCSALNKPTSDDSNIIANTISITSHLKTSISPKRRRTRSEILCRNTKS